MATDVIHPTYDADVAARYDANYSDAVCQAENRELAAMLDSLLSPGRPARRPPMFDILDVGCGTGLVPDLLSESETFREVWADGYVGIDLSDAMLNVAQQKHTDLHFLHGSMDHLDLLVNGCRFDAAVSTFALCHSDDPAGVIEQMWRVLSPGGRLLIVTNGPGFPRYPAKQANYITEEKPRLVSAGELAAYARASWFTDVTVTGFSYGSDLIRLERRILGRRFPNRAAYLVLEAVKQHG